MAIKLAIRGVGKAGRLAFRTWLESSDIEVIALIDDVIYQSIASLAYAFKYDTTHGVFSGTISGIDETNHTLTVNGKIIYVYNDANALTTIVSLGIDTVVDFSGSCTSAIASQYISAGIKHFLSNNIFSNSYPAVTTVNMSTLTSSASIVQTDQDIAALSLVIAPLNTSMSVSQADVTIIKTASSAMSADDDYTLTATYGDTGRSCLENIVIGSTNSKVKNIGLILPELNGKVTGNIVRVASLSGFALQLDAIVLNPDALDVDDVRSAMKTAAEGDYKTILYYTEDAITPVDCKNVLGTTYLAGKDKMSSVTGNYYKIKCYCAYYPENVAVEESTSILVYWANL